MSRIQQLLTGQRGSAMDKLRLVLVFLLTCEELPSDAELQRLESTLSALGADMHAFAYVLRMRKMKLTGQKMPPSQSYAEGLGALSSQSNNLINWADKTFGQGLSSLTKGVKNLLAGEQQAAVTVAVEQLMGGFTPDKEDTFAYFDPKVFSLLVLVCISTCVSSGAGRGPAAGALQGGHCVYGGRRQLPRVRVACDVGPAEPASQDGDVWRN